MPGPNLTVAQRVVTQYDEAIAHLLARAGDLLAGDVDSRSWAARKYAELTGLRRDARRTLEALEQASTVTGTVRDAYLDAYPGGDARAAEALAAEATRTVQSTHTRILRSVDDVYRQVIGDVAALGVTGAADVRSAAAEAMSRLAARGVSGYVDPAGAVWNLDSYVEMATRTAVGQAYLQGSIDRLMQRGRDLVIVSNSPEECPLCRPYEGKVLSLSGALMPPDVPGGMWGGSLAGARALGLFHPNCTHALGGYVPGLTEPMTDTENAEGYEDRQRQRTLERRVRDSKRRVAAVRPFGVTPALRRERALLRRRQAALDGFIRENNRKAYVSRQRTQLPGQPDYGLAAERSR